MGQPNLSTFNKLKKGWVAGSLERKHQSIIPGQNRSERLRDWPLHWETAVADFLETFGILLPLEYFDHAECIRRQWVAMFWKQCANEIQEARKKGRGGNKPPATDLGEGVANTVRGYVPELPNTTFMDVICRVPNGNNDQTFSIQLQALYTDVRHYEELIDLREKTVVRKNDTVWLQYTNPTWPRKNWTKSIWDYTHRGKRWMILYMLRFHTTDPSLMHSSRNCDTM